MLWYYFLNFALLYPLFLALWLIALLFCFNVALRPRPRAVVILDCGSRLVTQKHTRAHTRRFSWSLPGQMNFKKTGVKFSK